MPNVALMLPRFRWLDANGNPLNGGKVYVYEAGGTTPTTSYDETGASNTNPVILDSQGFADIWLPNSTSISYKIVITDSSDSVLHTIDDIYLGFLFQNASGPSFSGNLTMSTGNVVFSTASKGIVLKTGSNGRTGTVTANGTSQVSVANTSISTDDTIVLSLKTVGGTVGKPYVDTITAGVGFTIKSDASDTSTYNYAVIGKA